MSAQKFYRAAVWLPLLVPAVVAIPVHTLGMPRSAPLLFKLVQVLLMSGIYGGIPYAALAAWGTWWIDRRPEAEIRRRALFAPFWMLAAWTVCAAVIGTLSRRFNIFAGLVGLGALVILTLGYAYVALVFLLRRWGGAAGWLTTER